jgi:acyl-CoA synthetase (AMP-forming)/AMP-acid ligase II
LLESIEHPLTVRELYQPPSAQDALRELVRAAAVGVRLTLLDQSLTVDELQRIGIDYAEINRPSLHPLRIKVAEFPRWLSAAQNPGFTLELFTSGSTGLPTKVGHTLATLGRAVRISERHAADVWALAYPATHVAGVQVALQAMSNGNPLVDITPLRGAAASEAIIRHGVTHISATPTFYRLLVAARHTMPAVRAVTLGGEPSDGSLHASIREAFPHARLRNVYASTEAGTVLESDGEQFSVPPQIADLVRITDGRLFLHGSLLGKFDEKQKVESGKRTEMKLQKAENGKWKADGARCAEMAAKQNGKQKTESGGRMAMPQESQLSTFSSQLSEWYDTGDLVEIVSGAPLCFRIIGRQKEWVNVGGDKVNPREVEAVLRTHPAVVDLVVYGRKNSVMGSILCAEVVLKKAENGKLKAENGEQKADGAHCAEMAKQIGKQKAENGDQTTESELRSWLGERLQAHKIPRIIRFVTELNSTYSGKAMRP